jgi:hypothetical protein
VLAFLVVLGLLAALGLRRLDGPGRRFGLGVLASLGLLVPAMLVLYVVRERGGVWGGVRALMAWAPLLLVLASPLLFRARRLATALLLAGAFAGFAALDTWHVRYFWLYKYRDHEDQERNAVYLERWLGRYAPQRVVSRSFLYGWRNWPVEVVWSLPRDARELRALERAVPFDFVSVHERSSLRMLFVRNPRYVRVNKEDRGAEFLIWRRVD